LKITRIETAIATDFAPELIFCRIHTDEGLVGIGESFYIPEAVASVIHNWIAPARLLGADPFNIEGHWRFLYERMANFGARGAELRALSAIDLALWDLKGKALNQPIWQLLGGKTQQGVRTYNTSGGWAKRLPDPSGRSSTLPGYPSVGEKHPLNDSWRVRHEPVEYVKELISEKIKGVKMATLGEYAQKPGGTLHIEPADLKKGLEVFHKIREAVGDQIELILDGHGFFQLPAALRIAEAMKPIRPLWLEDVIRPDCVDTIRDFRDRCGLPVSVSEMIIGAEDYRLVLEKRAADYIMIDPTWVGGISQTLKITDFAQSFNVPVTMHDATGPLTMLAGLHVGIARANVAWQESIRAHFRMRYPTWISKIPLIVDGWIQAPTGAGIGTELNDDIFKRPENDVRVSKL